MEAPSGGYDVIVFYDDIEAAAFTNQLMQFFGSTEGLPYMAGEKRAVVWTGPIADDPTELYLNDRAMEGARNAGLRPRSEKRIGKHELPESLSLVIGDQRDWNDLG